MRMLHVGSGWSEWLRVPGGDTTWTQTKQDYSGDSYYAVDMNWGGIEPRQHHRVGMAVDESLPWHERVDWPNLVAGAVAGVVVTVLVKRFG